MAVAGAQAEVPVAQAAEQAVAVARETLVARVRPTLVAVVVVVAVEPVWTVALAVRASLLCVMPMCPPFRANQPHELCRLVRRQRSQSLLQQLAQRSRISGKKMVLIFLAQQQRVTPLLHQWSVTQARIALL